MAADPPEARTIITVRVPRHNIKLARGFPAESTTLGDVLRVLAPEAAAKGVNLLRTDCIYEDTTLRPSRNLTEEYGFASVAGMTFPTGGGGGR